MYCTFPCAVRIGSWYHLCLGLLPTGSGGWISVYTQPLDWSAHKVNNNYCISSKNLA